MAAANTLRVTAYEYSELRKLLSCTGTYDVCIDPDGRLSIRRLACTADLSIKENIPT